MLCTKASFGHCEHTAPTEREEQFRQERGRLNCNRVKASHLCMRSCRCGRSAEGEEATEGRQKGLGIVCKPYGFL